ncbi:hypothetical protein F4776DRAFT_621371 [Hypoxylon sp. NC0597]|nr:hypothetical protein F4776DRAFT_621371 [Hypoxylon sp. NC0597]
MCYQLIERYSACHCLYYQHAIDRCAAYGKEGHRTTARNILVGYACSNHQSKDFGFSSSTRPKTREKPKPTPALTPTKQPKSQPRKADDSPPIDRVTLSKPNLSRSSPESEDNGTIGLDDVISDSGSELTQLWDNESVVSVSSTSTVDPDAIEATFQKLLEYGDLRFLWPQVVIRCGSMKRGCHTVERFLRRYAEDLGRRASNLIDEDRMTEAEKLIRLSASRFIRRSRFDLAQRICEAHDYRTSESLGNDKTSFEGGAEHDFSRDAPDQEGDDNEETNFIYSVAEAFLFETEPIRCLELNIHTFLQPPQSALFYSTVAAKAELYFDKALRIFKKSSPAKGKRRLSWTCKCGLTISDDYIELQPGALNRLQELLYRYGKPSEQQEPFDVDNGPDIANGGIYMGQLWQQLKASLPGRNRGPILSRQRQDKSTSPKFGVCPKRPVAALADHLFILLCIPFRRWGTKLQQADTCDINSDREFFKALNYYYQMKRSRSKWTRLRRVTSIEFVEFELFRSELVDVRPGPSVPPAGQPNPQYTYETVSTLPPIGSNMLMHLFNHPEDADILPLLYRRIPKKLRLRLEACPIKGSAVGWGMHFVEGLNWIVLFGYGCMGFAVSLILAVVYAMLMSDVQGGFAIGGFMLAFFLSCAGLVGREIGASS